MEISNGVTSTKGLSTTELRYSDTNQDLLLSYCERQLFNGWHVMFCMNAIS